MFAVFLVVLGGPGPPGGSPETPGMLFQPKAPTGLGPIDDPPNLVAIRDILTFMFFTLRRLQVPQVGIQVGL